jgi:hypothetical protein
MPDFYFILFLMRLDADEKLQYLNLERVPSVGNILSIKAAFGDLETFITGEL